MGKSLRPISVHQGYFCGKVPCHLLDVGNDGSAGVRVVDRKQNLSKGQHNLVLQESTFRTKGPSHPQDWKWRKGNDRVRLRGLVAPLMRRTVSHHGVEPDAGSVRE